MNILANISVTVDHRSVSEGLANALREAAEKLSPDPGKVMDAKVWHATLVYLTTLDDFRKGASTMVDLTEKEDKLRRAAGFVERRK